MSRRPRPRYDTTTTGAPPPGQRPLDFMPIEHADLLEMELDLARTELEIETAPGTHGHSLLDLSALIAHVLSMYQDRYAGEAFLGSALSPRSLIRHGRRLAYEPDPGLAATGYLRLLVKEDVAGRVDAGFGVAGESVAGNPPQTYETLSDLEVDAKRNELTPRHATVTVMLTQGETTIIVDGQIGADVVGSWIVLVSRDETYLKAHRVVSASPKPWLTGVADQAGTISPVERPVTELEIDPVFQGESAPASNFRIFALPEQTMHLFGWNSPVSIFTDQVLAGEWDSEEFDRTETYIDGELARPLADTPLVRLQPGPAADDQVATFMVDSKRTLTMSFSSTESITLPTDPETTVEVDHVHQGPVTGVRFRPQLDEVVHDIRDSRWLGQWQVEAELVSARPNPEAPDASALELDRLIESLAPGQLLELADPNNRAVVEVTRVSLSTDGCSVIAYRQMPDAITAHPWKLGTMKLHGNVARISHGETIAEEVVGGSDGVTHFQSFELKQSPVTYVPGGNRAVPEIEVRVGTVRWDRVDDFWASGREDRHYRLQRDHEGVTTIMFGDGVQGAIPPAGRKHITVTYRVGLGELGNAAAMTVSKVKKSNPIIELAYNPLRIRGGSNAASAADVLSQATRPIKTFDRAVSVEDHADLAMTFEGVARASADWVLTYPGGSPTVRVVVADSSGETPSSIDAIRTFLETHRDNGSPMRVIGPTPVNVALGIYLEHEAAYLRAVVEDRVRDALHGATRPGLFTFAGRDLGQPAFRSEIYDLISDVEGVAFVEITTFGFSAGQLADTITVQSDQWLRLSPAALALTGPS